jgi:hypothetical protein
MLIGRIDRAFLVGLFEGCLKFDRHWFTRCIFAETFALATFFHHGRAFTVIKISDLAIQAVMALIGVDLTGGPDRLHLALFRADLTGPAALFASP